MLRSPFYALASEVLSAITCLLDADSVFAFARLCGDRTIATKLGNFGGVSELHVITEKALKSFALNCYLLPLFPRLTSITVSVASNTRWPPQIFQLLPQTIRHIRLSSCFCFDAWLRPIDEHRDSDWVKTLTATEGVVPVSMKELYPTLQTLSLVERYGSNATSQVWPSFVLSHFVKNLPDTLLALHLRWTSAKIDATPARLFNRMPNLERFSFTLRTVSYKLKDLLCDGPYPWDAEKHGIPALLERQLFNFDHLISLETLSLSDHASIALLPHLRNLKHLSMRIDGGYLQRAPIPLPSQLDELRFEISSFHEAHFAQTLGQVPLLRTLFFRFTENRGVAQSHLSGWPPTLTTLDIGPVHNSSVTLVLVSPPATLTELRASTCPVRGLDFYQLPNLKILHLREWQSNLPSTISRLCIRSSVSLVDFLTLSGPLTVFDTHLKFDLLSRHLLNNSLHCTRDELKKIVRDLLQPRGVTLDPSCSIVLAQEMGPVMLKERTLGVLRSLDLSMLGFLRNQFPPGAPYPQQLTSLVTSMAHTLLLSDLPRNLVNLNLTSQNTSYYIPSEVVTSTKRLKDHFVKHADLVLAATRVYVSTSGHLELEYAEPSQEKVPLPKRHDPRFKEPFKRVRGRNSNVLSSVSLITDLALQHRHCALPPTLQSLTMTWPIIMKCDPDREAYYMVYPPLQTAPLLTSLDLQTIYVPFSGLGLSFINHLPNTLTSLVLAFRSWSPTGSEVLPVPADWLPLLTRLTVSGICFPLDSIYYRINTFNSLHLKKLLVPADLVPAFSDDDLGDSLLEDRLVHHLLVHLFPPHLRNLDTVFSVEWGRDLALRLPRTLKTLEVVFKPSPAFTSSQAHFARNLPRSLTHLNVLQYYASRNLDVDELPQSLTVLMMQIRRCPNITAYLKRLPRALISLTLFFINTQAPTRQMMAALPRQLQRFELRARRPIPAGSHDVFDDLPETLQHLQLSVSAPNEDHSYALLRRLPPSLVYLHFETDCKSGPHVTFKNKGAFLEPLFPCLLCFSCIHYRENIAHNPAPPEHGLRMATLRKRTREDDTFWTIAFAAFIANFPNAPPAQQLWAYEATFRKAQSTGYDIQDFNTHHAEPQRTQRLYEAIVARDPSLQQSLAAVLLACGISVIVQ